MDTTHSPTAPCDTERKTQSGYADHDLKVEGKKNFRQVKVHVVKDIRKYKGKKIKLHADLGYYNGLEICLFRKNVERYVGEVKKLSENKGQAGWDPLGTFALASSLERIGTEARALGEQAGANVDRLNATVSTTIQNAIRDLIPTLTQGVSGVNKIANEGLDFNLNFDTIFKLFDDPATAMVIASALYLLIEIVERKYEIPNLLYIKVLVGAFVVYKCGSKILSLYQSWITPPVSVPQADWTDWLTVGCQGVLFAVFGCTMDVTTLTSTVKTLADSASNALRLQELFTVIVEWLKKALTLVCETFGVETFEWLKPQDKRIRSMMEKVNALTLQYSLNPMAVGVEFAEEVTRTLMDLNDYMSHIPVTSKNQPVSNAIRTLQEKMQVLHRNVVDAGMVLGERSDPAFIIIAGPPGVGKTYLTDYLTQRISINTAETVGEIMDAQRNYKTNVYVWPLENKHHDQYRGEKIVLYPDLFCQTDAEGQPSEATSLIYVVGGQPHQLPAAEINKKQRLYFISQVIIACTNVVYIHNHMFKSVRNADAVKRRCDDYAWYMTVNPRFIKRDVAGNAVVDPNTNRIRGYEGDDEMYGMLDVSLLPEWGDYTVMNEIWSFRRLSMSKGEFTDNKVYNYENFSRLCEKYITEVKAKGTLKKERLAETAEILALRKFQEFGMPQAGDIQYREVEPRVVNPIPVVKVAEYELDLEARRRILLKDELDALRYRAMLRGRPPNIRLERPIPVTPPNVESESDYETTDEEDINAEGQMDDEELLANIRARRERVAFLDREEVREVDFLDLEGTVGHHTSRVMNHEVDRHRKLSWNLYKKIFSSKLDPIQHRRLREILTDAINSVDFDGVMDLRGLALNIATRGTDFSPRRGLIFRVLQAAVLALEGDISTQDIVKSLSCENILKLASMEYEEANGTLWKMKLSYLIKDPLLLAVTQASLWMSETYNTLIAVHNRFIRPVTDRVYTILRNIYYTPRFQMVLDIVFTSVVSVFASIGILFFIDLYLNWVKENQNKEKKRRQEESKSRETRFQGDWVNMEMNKKVIDKYMDNMCGVYVVIHMGDTTATRHPCNMLFLGGKTGVIVNHAHEALVEIYEKVKTKPGHYIEIVIVPFISTTLEKSTERFRFEDIILETSPELQHYDLSIIKFKHCVNRPHVYNLIPPVKCLEYIADMENLEGIFIERTTDTELAFKGPERRVPVRFNIANNVTNYRCSAPVYGEEVPLSSYSYNAWTMRGKEESFVTYAGYCSSPGFVIDDRKNFCVKEWKQAQQPWLCYLHTSLQGLVPNGAPIYREMFTKWIDEIQDVKIKPVVDVIQENLDIYSSIIEEELKLLPDGEQSSKMEIVSAVEKLDENHSSKALMDYILFVPMKSEIKRSPLYGIEGRTRYPSRMGTVRLKDGTVVDTMQKARENYGINPTLLNGSLIDAIVHQAMARVMSDSSLPKLREVLSLDQCLYGDGAYKLNSVNWNSSAGFYFRMMKEKYGTKWKGKQWMLEETGVVKPDIYRVISRLFNLYNEKLTRGERIFGLNIDNVKDELLKKEKVAKADSRLFCTNDFIELLLCKSHMGAFAGWIYDNRINNGIAIGVNPLSEEWDAIATSLINNSPDCVFMDHSKFDKKQLRQIMKCVLVLMDMYYGDKNSCNSKIRELLFEDIVDSIHVTMYKGKLHFYTWGQGNTSGNFLTAILNSLVNLSYLYICSIFAWLIHNGIEPNTLTALPPNPADKSLKAICLGDDIVASIKKDRMPGVNFNSIKMMGKIYLGIDITDELKSEGVIPDFRSITDGSFLGRRFELTYIYGKRRFIGILRRYSAVERVQWLKGLYDPTIEIEKMEDCFLERSLDDREDFEKLVALYAPACLKEYGRYPRFTDYDIARKHALTLSEYKYSFNDFMDDEDFSGIDLGKLLLKLKEEELKNRYESGIKRLDVSDVSSDFNVKTTTIKTSVGEEPSL